jgi:hypothetical protein
MRKVFSAAEIAISDAYIAAILAENPYPHYNEADDLGLHLSTFEEDLEAHYADTAWGDFSSTGSDGDPHGGFVDKSLSPYSERKRFRAHTIKATYKTRAWAANRAIQQGQAAASSESPDVVMMDSPCVEGIFNPSGVLEPFEADGSLSSDDLSQPSSDPTPVPSDSDSSAPPKPPAAVYLTDSLRTKIYSYLYLPPPVTHGGWGSNAAALQYQVQYQSRQHYLVYPHNP